MQCTVNYCCGKAGVRRALQTKLMHAWRLLVSAGFLHGRERQRLGGGGGYPLTFCIIYRFRLSTIHNKCLGFKARNIHTRNELRKGAQQKKWNWLCVGVGEVFGWKPLHFSLRTFWVVNDTGISKSWPHTRTAVSTSRKTTHNCYIMTFYPLSEPWSQYWKKNLRSSMYNNWGKIWIVSLVLWSKHFILLLLSITICG